MQLIEEVVSKRVREASPMASDNSSERESVVEIRLTKRIVVEASEAHIDSIKEVLKDDFSGAKKLGNKLHELKIHYNSIKSTEVSGGRTLGDKNRLYGRSQVDIAVFNGYVDFYEEAKNKKSYKIISDEFSDELNTRLYRGFNRIESSMREVILEKIPRADSEFKKPNNYRSKEVDHYISQFTLGEFIVNVLSSPASDSYIKKCWFEGAQKEDDLLRIRKLTVLDEHPIGISASDLKWLNKIRNKCMHFNVTTPEDYKKTAKIINNFLIKLDDKEFHKSLQELSTRIIWPDVTLIQKSINNTVITSLASSGAGLRRDLLNALRGQSRRG